VEADRVSEDTAIPCTCTIACIPQGLTDEQTCRLWLENDAQPKLWLEDETELKPGVYVYAWGNNERRAELKGRRCVIEAPKPGEQGRMNTVLVRFLDTGERVTTSVLALR
jgi:hypothetical protein